jgi:hypothetical protein
MRIFNCAGALFIIIGCILLFNVQLFADRHSSVEVSQLIQEVSERLHVIKQNGAEEYAADEVLQVFRLIQRSSQLLSRSEQDKAYYEIIKARGFFQLIEARRKYIEALCIDGGGLYIPNH